MTRFLPLLLLWLTACPDSTTADFDGDGTEDYYDCAPADAGIHPGAQEVRDDGIDQDCDGVDLACDSDGDGVLAESCGGLDCDDSNGNRFTGATEACNALDDDCDGDVPVTEVDADEDGFAPCEGDCDDFDSERAPGLDEVCDGLDNDCNDEVPAGEVDGDLDGFPACAECDDARAEAHPGAEEACNALDDDCDGVVPADEVDGDQDGSQGCEECDDADASVEVLDLDGDGSTTCDGDCDDTDPLRHPNAGDLPLDGLDSDCSGIDGVDADGDGTPGFDSSGPLPPEFAGLLDCDDNDASLNIDDADADGSTTCDGDCDDADPLIEALDADGDGRDTCGPDGLPDTGDEDCDDDDPTVLPGVAELCDGMDTDCDGALGPGDEDGDGDGDPACSDCADDDASQSTLDLDGDGVLSCGADCDDNDPEIRPDVFDLLGDGVDANCDGIDGSDNDGDGDAQGDDCDDSDATLNLNDADGDGATSCGGDCDDLDAAANSNDADFDGFSTCAGDCDDSAFAVNPAAAEACDLIDNDCDGSVPAEEVDADQDGSLACEECDDTDASVESLDVDGDGVTTCDQDCDDQDAARYPGASDLPLDGLDADCSGLDGVDADGDGFAGLDFSGPLPPEFAGLLDCDDNDTSLNLADEDGDGSTTCDGDCDDTDPTVEVLDADGDGTDTCGADGVPGTGDEDCDDSDPAAFPGAIEVCDGIDTDCDGALGVGDEDLDGDGDAACDDCNDDDATLTTLDLDGDGALSCGYDCNDADPAIHPLAADLLGDGDDSNCDGIDGLDSDGDGYAQGEDCNDSDAAMNLDDLDGDGASTCGGDCDDSDPALNATDGDFDGFSTCAGDCNDAVYAINPAATEVCDLIDNDCDAVQDPTEVDGDGDGDPACSDCDDTDPLFDSIDADGDGFSLCDGDCDDTSIVWHPVALDPVGDGWDTNCDDLDGVDQDQDGVASVASGGLDCDDTDPTIFPDAIEIPFDSIDQDCDGLDGLDADGDGFIDQATGGDDCDDSDANTWPGAPDSFGDGVDQDCDGTDGVDADGDGWASTASSGFDCDDSDPAIHPGGFDGADDSVDSNCDGLDGLVYQEFDGTVTTNYDQLNADGNCDVNGDGFTDLVMGETYAEFNNSGDQGAVWIFFGPVVTGTSVEQADVFLFGADDANVGSEVACAGDSNGDGYDDLLMRGSSGEGIWLFPGPILGNQSTDAATHFDWVNSFELPGDVDGDGADDVLLCPPGWPAEPCGLHLSPWAGVSETTVPIATLDVGHNSLATDVGDFDGDGTLDLLVGNQSSAVVAANAGAAFVFDGPLWGTLAAGNADATLVPVAGWRSAGNHVNSLGDIDGDGMDDLFVGVTCTVNCSSLDPDAPLAGGLAAVFLGPVSGWTNLTTADQLISVEYELSYAVGCDLNDDGVSDLTLSENKWDPLTTTSTYSLHHVPGPLHEASDPGPGQLLFEGQAYPVIGGDFPAVPKCAGDITGQGKPDLLFDGWESVVWLVPNPTQLFCTTTDVDGDGVTECDGDCADLDATIEPTAADDVGDGVDNDCDGIDGVDSDGDGVASIASGGLDCDDSTGQIAPGAPEIFGDGVDQDCDGIDAVDSDGDGDASVVSGGGDCDDSDSDRWSTAVELCGDSIDQDCDGIDTWCPDPSYSLASTADLVLLGVDADDEAGATLATGDFNGDGYDDLVVGALWHDGPAGPSSGALYIFNGPLSSGTLSVATADAVRWGSASFALLYGSMVNVGDMNGDGNDDLLVGTPRLLNDASQITGGALLLHGPFTGSSTISASTAAAAFHGETAGGNAGSAVGSGDFNGDGTPDLLISAPEDGTNGPAAGIVYVVHGPVLGEQDLAFADARLLGAAPYDHAGSVVTGAGDTDGDGNDDILVVANLAGVLMPNSGAAYLVLGPASGDLDLDLADARVLGLEVNDIGYESGATAADLDGDGLSDLVIGSTGSTNRGVHVYYGPISGDHTLLESDATLQGAGLGGAVRPAGDYNVDGMADLLVSDSGTAISTNVTGAGMAYLVPGPVAGTIDLPSSCRRWDGGGEWEGFAEQLRAGGDLNNDGWLDFVFGTPDYSVDLNDRGAVFVVFGP